MGLAQQNIVPIYGLDYKDKRDDALMQLSRGGNPYVLSVMDREGRTGIDYGVYGVPETYVIDKQGIIRYKQIGPVNDQNLRETILPLVAELQKK
jgi:cytochrome c biogenesis protein CcmG/thiol:disulfide interchange protein DsbE